MARLDHELAAGTVIGSYRIEAPLGRGGMGAVYLAEHVHLKRRVALKVLAPDLAGDSDFRERFVQESQLAASIDHPNVMPVYDANDENGVLHIAMRYVEGSDLKALVALEGPLDAGRTLDVISQVASGLDAAHARGLVHRDVKPANAIIETETGRVFVTDFGIAKLVAGIGMTRTGSFLGTIEYASPEQFEGKDLDRRSDVYSLGCMLFYCLAGRPPYVRDTQVAVMHAHMTETPRRLAEVTPGLPPAIDAVIARAMAKRREDRFATAGDVAFALRSALEQGTEALPTVAEPAELPGALSLPDRPSIAVLPFANMSGEADQEFVADGLAEDIITGLSKLRWLFVIARNSTFTYKGRSVDVREVGRDLGVRYVLEGSVRTSGSLMRITAQLIEAETGKHLWADRYDRPLADVFAVQDEITESVIGCIQPEVYAAEHERVKRKPPQSLDAWEGFIRAVFLYSQHSDASTREALEILDRVVALDASYAQAQALRAVCLAWRTLQGWGDRKTPLEAAAAAANSAMACDPNEPWAFLARGFLGFAAHDDSEAVDAFSRAIEASPNFAYAHGLLGAAHAFGGRADAAIPCIDRGVRLSPRDIFGEEFQLYYAFAYFQAARYAEAASAARAALQQRPGHPSPYIVAAAAHGLAGESEKARELAAQLQNLVPDISATDVEENFPYSRPEDRSRLAAGLREAGIPD